MEGLTQLVKVDIRPSNLPEFFWCHLERDMELLGRAIGKNMDESAIVVHLVLKEILSRDPPPCEDCLTTLSVPPVMLLGVHYGHSLNTNS